MTVRLLISSCIVHCWDSDKTSVTINEIPCHSSVLKKQQNHPLFIQIRHFYLLKLESTYGQTINFKIYHFLTVNMFPYIYMYKNKMCNKKIIVIKYNFYYNLEL